MKIHINDNAQEKRCAALRRQLFALVPTMTIGEREQLRAELVAHNKVTPAPAESDERVGNDEPLEDWTATAVGTDHSHSGNSNSNS